MNMNGPRTNIGRNLNMGSSPSLNLATPSPNTGGIMKNMSDTATSMFTGWGLIVTVIVVLMILFAVYYNTIGYYIDLGWKKLMHSRERGETVEIRVPGGPSAQLTPAPEDDSPRPTGGAGGTSFASSLSGAVSRIESDVESALGITGPGGKQVFNISRNVYKYSEAEPLCRAFGAELATYDQVKEAYEAGADWCNYGWIKGQMSVYPTQESTYDKLQHGPEADRMSCGVPGVNGGYFPNEDQRFGVNCYGARPAESALDERVQMEEHSNIAYDREVSKFKAERDSIAVNPWSAKQWSY
jgi:hypothetical protein